MKYQVEFNEELFCYLKHNFEINWMVVAKCPVTIISCIFRTIFAKKREKKIQIKLSDNIALLTTEYIFIVL